ncbi:MAG: hypothetical protein GY952_16195 [Rhodobacteraceae bacterium]|nr:hypothetical protein [Paracoccaceae bacterium]
MKALIVTAATLFIALPAMAQETTITKEEFQPMPAHVQASIEELRKYGDRFEKSIAAIEAQWQNPSWSFEADCADEELAQVEPAS